MSTPIVLPPLLDGRGYLPGIGLQFEFMVNSVCLRDFTIVVLASAQSFLFCLRLRMYCLTAGGRRVRELLPRIPFNSLGDRLAERLSESHFDDSGFLVWSETWPVKFQLHERISSDDCSILRG